MLARIAARMQRLLERRGLDSGGADLCQADPVVEESPALAGISSASIQGRIALGPRAGARVWRVGDDPDAPWVLSTAPRHAHLAGFELHANVAVPAADRPRLEQLCRYLLRPAVAQDRLRLLADGRIVLTLETAWADGTRQLVFEPLTLLEKLAALTPRPRINLVLYHGVLAPHAGWRARVVAYGALPVEAPIEDPAGMTGHGTSSPTVVTVYARSSHPQGPAGVSYWNPDHNTFVWYGKTIGVPGGVDINRTGPVRSASSPVFGSVTFGPGDVWVGGLQFQPLYVHFAGTNRFRSFGTPSRLMPSSARAWGVKVDQSTGDVFVVLPGPQPSEGAIVRLSPLAPASEGFAVTTDWIVGGVGAGPAGITLDSVGRPYTTLSGLDIVVRVDPGADGVLGSADDIATFWRVPNRGGVRSFRTVPPAVPVLGEEYPNAIITTDDDGNVWFTESNSDEIGRDWSTHSRSPAQAPGASCRSTSPRARAIR